jgi:hypothetical protein
VTGNLYWTHFSNSTICRSNIRQIQLTESFVVLWWKKRRKNPFVQDCGNLSRSLLKDNADLKESFLSVEHLNKIIFHFKLFAISNPFSSSCKKPTCNCFTFPSLASHLWKFRKPLIWIFGIVSLFYVCLLSYIFFVHLVSVS